MANELQQKIQRFILENYLFTDDPAALSPDESLLKQGIVDSTGMMQIIAFIEEELGVPVADEEMIPENLESVNKIVRFALSKLQTA
ncbi:MAG: acyl carrier protein [Betaproteobacteria bacterium RIFCSPLOWO2_02_FULL_65_24]|nr:MAG: acyl carrier protein [Betaproteobacteria bacterium RIFCSPLOWO2_02_FULL_65_24]OGA76867.1 MAG: acyl carrier protein [Betaproteobacteria bacterium RIFCSPLOWO2_12_FULL_66_14]